jgi:hypothetical protein
MTDAQEPATDTSKPQSEQRMEICKACDQFQSLLQRCAVCGCLMPLKVLFDNSVCPKGKW